MPARTGRVAGVGRGAVRVADRLPAKSPVLETKRPLPGKLTVGPEAIESLDRKLIALADRLDGHEDDDRGQDDQDTCKN